MLDKKYNHIKVENGKYENWKEKGYFKGGNTKLKPYAIVIPPPNVTGKLHLGHAWNTTIQDIMIRFKKMKGYDAIWIPGMDHAGIATQAKVDKRLRDNGINPREMEREKWLEAAWSWKDEYAQNIHNQWAKLGLALDYTKERFTLDEGLSKAVRYVFVELYKKGLIYRGERIINWDPVQMTALSNEEVIYSDEKGAFYHIKYYIDGSEEYLDVATTRPETLFGDTAVAVNPEDERYKKYIGKNVILPILNKKIPVIADEHADMEKGTGVVKITPAHDPNDFQVGERHNLEKIIIMNKDATMNEKCGKYAGLNRFECRESLVNDLKEQGLLIDIEEIIHSVGHSERSKAIVEPYLSKQWFVKMRPLADRVLLNQKDKNQKVNFVPERYEKTMKHWMEITYDWCISRQLWWGHKIPAWYKDDKVYVGMDSPSEEGWIQDEDVLDTWFSSALWPFSTLGWPEDTEMFKRYYPNNILVTGYDIIPFWVNRMTFQGLEFTNKRPFKDCIIHGLIRAKDGRKMSKSLGNGIDPMDVIEEYGADALRYYLTTDCAAGTDLKFDMDKIKSTWNFINKLWNASRYVLMNIDDMEYTLDNLTLADRWILTKLNNTIKIVTEHMDKYEFNIVGSTLYNFIWNDFCDWYIELSKANMNNTSKSVLTEVLKAILKMLHPFMPFVTEEVYTKLKNTEDSIMLSKYPLYKKEYDFKDYKDMDDIINLIKLIRKLKKDKGVKDIIIKHNSKILKDNEYIINALLKPKDMDISSLECMNYTFKDSIVSVYYDNSVSKAAEEDKLYQDKQTLENSIARRKKLLSNENYINKAPKEIVDKDRESLKKEESLLSDILKKLEEL